MERSEPINAAPTIAAELRSIPFCIANIMESATVSFAPDDMPRTYGPAIGLLKKLCNRKPDTESAPPRSAAAIARGSRISVTIVCAELLLLFVSARNTSPAVSLVLPLTSSRMKKTTVSAVITAKQIVQRTILFLLITPPQSSL